MFDTKQKKVKQNSVTLVAFVILSLGLSAWATNGPSVSLRWTEHWHEHRENLTLAYTDENLALYLDPFVNSTSTTHWLSSILSKAWKYAKATYGSFGSDSHLYVVLHYGNYKGCHVNTFLHERHGHKNVIDCGESNNETNAWDTSNSLSFVRLLTAFGHVIRGGAKGVDNNADGGICAEWIREIIAYDIGLQFQGKSPSKTWEGWVAEKHSEMSKSGIYWFRDWFLPIYDQNGGASVINTFYTFTYLYREHYDQTYDEEMNLGEFVHFWSAAARTDLLPLAKKAMNWTEENTEELEFARSNFKQLAYPGSGPNGTTPSFLPPTTLHRKLSGQSENLTLVYVGDHAAIYFPKFELYEAHWIHTISSTWTYATENYMPFPTKPNLFIVIHNYTLPSNNGRTTCISSNNNSLAGKQFNGRNVIECGPFSNPHWFYMDDHALEEMMTNVAFMSLKLTMAGSSWPEFKISGWMMASIIVYDLYLDTSMWLQAKAWKAEKFEESGQNSKMAGIFWFRDWYFKIYVLHGGPTVLQKYFSILHKHWLAKEPGKNSKGREMLNMGEFVHFWSGAAGENLRDYAVKAFGWNQGYQDEFVEARKSYSGINYSCLDCSELPGKLNLIQSDGDYNDEIETVSSLRTAVGLLATLLIFALATFLIKFMRDKKKIATLREKIIHLTPQQFLCEIDTELQVQGRPDDELLFSNL